jgi:hypothetical protein
MLWGEGISQVMLMLQGTLATRILDGPSGGVGQLSGTSRVMLPDVGPVGNSIALAILDSPFYSKIFSAVCWN